MADGVGHAICLKYPNFIAMPAKGNTLGHRSSIPQTGASASSVNPVLRCEQLSPST